MKLFFVLHEGNDLQIIKVFEKKEDALKFVQKEGDSSGYFVKEGIITEKAFKEIQNEDTEEIDLKEFLIGKTIESYEKFQNDFNLKSGWVKIGFTDRTSIKFMGECISHEDGLTDVSIEVESNKREKQQEDLLNFEDFEELKNRNEKELFDKLIKCEGIKLLEDQRNSFLVIFNVKRVPENINTLKLSKYSNLELEPPEKYSNSSFSIKGYLASSFWSRKHNITHEVENTMNSVIHDLINAYYDLLKENFERGEIKKT